MYQNYPNPFNSQTTIRFKVPHKSYVIIKLYDIIGNEIRTLFNNECERGEHAFQFDAQNLTSGAYFYRIFADNYISTKKMVIVK